jgi:hypothetical protein
MLAPASRIASSAAGSTPAAAPARPACTAAITRACGSAIKIGTQSAVSATRARPWREVTTASVAGTAGACGPSTIVAVAPCTWSIHSSRSPARPMPSASRRRFAATCAGSSPMPVPRLNDSYGGTDTPPARVVTTRRIRTP